MRGTNCRLSNDFEMVKLRDVNYKMHQRIQKMMMEEKKSHWTIQKIEEGGRRVKKSQNISFKTR